jgi:hypothetical protein
MSRHRLRTARVHLNNGSDEVNFPLEWICGQIPNSNYGFGVCPKSQATEQEGHHDRVT